MNRVSRLLVPLVSVALACCQVTAVHGQVAPSPGPGSYVLPPPVVPGVSPITGQPLIGLGGPEMWQAPVGPAPIGAAPVGAAPVGAAPIDRPVAPASLAADTSACDFRFPRGAGTLEFMAGAYVSSALGPVTPAFNWAPVSIRIGRILDFPCADGFLGGCFEPMLELTAAPVIGSYGKFLVGPSMLLRYNCVKPDCKVVPYWQVGAGFIYSDAYQDETQRAIGQALEFYLQAQIGVKWFVRDCLSLNAEAGFIHISNCNMAPRNSGVNAFGAMVGMTYYFPRSWK